MFVSILIINTPKILRFTPTIELRVQEVCQKQTYHPIAKGRLCFIFLYFSEVYMYIVQ